MIHIITPCSRLEYLSEIAKGMTGVLWWVLPDTKEPGASLGNYQKNLALDMIKDGWVYVLDDDTKLHDDFITAIKEAIKTPGIKAISFDQSYHGRTRKGGVYSVGNIDQGQYIVRRDLIGNTRYDQSYTSDGAFIETLYRKEPESFMYLNKVLSHYNYFRGES